MLTWHVCSCYISHAYTDYIQIWWIITMSSTCSLSQLYRFNFALLYLVILPVLLWRKNVHTLKLCVLASLFLTLQRHCLLPVVQTFGHRWYWGYRFVFVTMQNVAIRGCCSPRLLSWIDSFRCPAVDRRYFVLDPLVILFRNRFQLSYDFFILNRMVLLLLRYTLRRSNSYQRKAFRNGLNITFDTRFLKLRSLVFNRSALL